MAHLLLAPMARIIGQQPTVHGPQPHPPAAAASRRLRFRSKQPPPAPLHRRLRLRGKQSFPTVWPFSVPSGTGFLAGLSAIEHEAAAADGLVPLPMDGKRSHVHYTHVRTHSQQDVQPSQITRMGLWGHLIRCYREAYPDAASDTGSILQFGVVCMEKHKDAAHESDRSVHHHVAVYCSRRHYWRRVRKISAAKYNIQLNAVAHDSYCIMYKYLRGPTKKKPLF